MAVLNELREILAGLGVDPGLLTPDVRLRSGLALSSAETTELGLELERRFGVQVDLWDAADYTVAGLADAVSAELEAPATAGEGGTR